MLNILHFLTMLTLLSRSHALWSRPEDPSSAGSVKIDWLIDALYLSEHFTSSMLLQDLKILVKEKYCTDRKPLSHWVFAKKAVFGHFAVYVNTRFITRFLCPVSEWPGLVCGSRVCGGVKNHIPVVGLIQHVAVIPR